MDGNPKRVFVWIKDHPWRTTITGSIGTAILSALADSLVNGTESYALKVGRTIVFAWHPFPVLGWLAIAPLTLLGVYRLWERFGHTIKKTSPQQDRTEWNRDDVIRGIRWRSYCRLGQDGNWSVEGMRAYCANPACDKELSTVESNTGIRFGYYCDDCMQKVDAPGGLAYEKDYAKRTIERECRREVG